MGIHHDWKTQHLRRSTLQIFKIGFRTSDRQLQKTSKMIHCWTIIKYSPMKKVHLEQEDIKDERKVIVVLEKANL